MPQVPEDRSGREPEGMRALRHSGMQQLHQDDGVIEEDTDVPGVLRGKVIFSGSGVLGSCVAIRIENSRIRIPFFFDIHTPPRL